MTRQMPSTVSSGRRPRVPLGDPAHHLGLATRAEGRAAALPGLDGDELVDDAAALDQQPVHAGVDAVDLDPEGFELRRERNGGVECRDSQGGLRA